MHEWQELRASIFQSFEDCFAKQLIECVLDAVDNDDMFRVGLGIARSTWPIHEPPCNNYTKL
jgi:hypothetical protein